MPLSLYRVASFPSIHVSSETLSLNNSVICSLYPGCTITGEGSFHNLCISDTLVDTDGTELVSHWTIYHILEENPQGYWPITCL